ncbi:MAG: hypothetical protein V1708_04475 [Candidatus Micrarchaeota archaeon]
MKKSVYLFDSIYSMNFIYMLAILSTVVWVVLRQLFGAQSFWNAMVLAFLGMIFMPLIMGAAQTMVAALLLVGIGALVIQWMYMGASLSAAVAAMVVVLIVSSVVTSTFY